MTRARDAALGFLYVLLVTALIALSIAIYNRDFSDVVRASVRTDTIGSSLQKGSDVEVRGILVGRVTGVHTDGQGATIDIDVDGSRARHLPADVTAELLPKTLFGERYVSLVLPADGTDTSGGTLHGGEVIPQDTSARSAELQEVFNNLLPVLQAVQPDKLATLLGELAGALRGRGTELGTAVTAFTGYLQEFAPKVPEFDADIAAFGRVAQTYSVAAPDLLSALNDFTTTSQTIVADRQQLADAFSDVAAASDTITGVVGTDQQDIIDVSRDSVPVLSELADYSTEFPCISQALADFIPVADRAFGVGTSQPGLHVDLKVVAPLPGSTVAEPTSGAPACPYTPAGNLGATAAGTVLARSTAPAPRPAASSRPAAPSLPTSTSGGTDGIGTANSPAENELIAELEAPTLGLSPAAFPRWGSLLLGPMLRGTSVTLR